MNHCSFSVLRERMSLEAQAEVRDRTDKIKRILQEEPAGCVVASLAMATEKTYQEVRDWFLNGDFCKYGIIYLDAHSYLGEHGYAVIHKWKHLAPRMRDRSPWPPEPFAPVHICFVRTSGTHAVVMMADGTVLDPAREGEYRLADYPEVSCVTGIYPVEK